MGLLVYAWAAATMFRMIVRRVREGRPATYADMKETDQIGAFAVAFVILGVLIGIGYALLVIPGLILVTLWIYALPLVVDRRIGVGEAMSESRRLAAAPGYFTTFLTWLVGALVVGIIVSVLNVIPVVGLIVGLLAVPFELAYVLSMYFQATGEGGLVDAAVGRRRHRRIGGSESMDIGKLFRDAWGLFVKDIGPLIVGVLIASIVPAIAAVVIAAATVGASISGLQVDAQGTVTGVDSLNWALIVIGARRASSW